MVFFEEKEDLVNGEKEETQFYYITQFSKQGFLIKK